jgi:hypothetical protein
MFLATFVFGRCDWLTLSIRDGSPFYCKTDFLQSYALSKVSAITSIGSISNHIIRIKEGKLFVRFSLIISVFVCQNMADRVISAFCFLSQSTII